MSPPPQSPSGIWIGNGRVPRCKLRRHLLASTIGRKKSLDNTSFQTSQWGCRHHSDLGPGRVYEECFVCDNTDLANLCSRSWRNLSLRSAPSMIRYCTYPLPRKPRYTNARLIVSACKDSSRFTENASSLCRVTRDVPDQSRLYTTSAFTPSRRMSRASRHGSPRYSNKNGAHSCRIALQLQLVVIG